MRRVMVINAGRCVGCEACVVACKTENAVPDGQYRDWVVQETRGELPSLELFIQSQRCNHCTDAPCVSNCPTGASFYRGDGTVQINRDACTGCKACIASCPYDARFVHPDGYADKCTFCMHRVKQGQLPACVSVCPTHCMHFGDLDDPHSDVSRLLASRDHHALLPEAGTGPRVFFLT